MTTAFVLGGGGLLGAHEVGMLRALAEAGVRPDLVVGTSIGAMNGVIVAADPVAFARWHLKRRKRSLDMPDTRLPIAFAYDTFMGGLHIAPDIHERTAGRRA